MTKTSLLILVCSILVVGCQHRGTVCKLIKTADDICTTIEYLGEDGKVHRVRLSKEELNKATESAAKREGLSAPAPKSEEKSEK